MVTTSASIRTLADLMKRLGDVPLERVRFHPPPGTATVADVTRIQEHEGRLCELIEGVLLEKTEGLKESQLTVFLATLLYQYVLSRNLGIVTGADGAMQLVRGLVRIPDVSFVNRKRFPDGRVPDEPAPLLAPDLAVEVLCASNRPGEMTIKRAEYFETGVKLVWEVDPKKRIIVVYTSPTESVQLGVNDVLDGGEVLRGFQLPLKDLFAELDRHG